MKREGGREGIGRRRERKWRSKEELEEDKYRRREDMGRGERREAGNRDSNEDRTGVMEEEVYKQRRKNMRRE